MKKIDITYLEDKPIPLNESSIVSSIEQELLINSSKIIGILGSWGSGKSSIIESLKNNKKIEILEYDAWQNEGFPFKLGFLKFLMKILIEESGDDDIKKLDEKLSVLQKIKDTQKSVTYSLINLVNALTAIPILFYPLAFNMIIYKKTSLYFFPIWNILMSSPQFLVQV